MAISTYADAEGVSKVEMSSVKESRLNLWGCSGILRVSGFRCAHPISLC